MAKQSTRVIPAVPMNIDAVQTATMSSQVIEESQATYHVIIEATDERDGITARESALVAFLQSLGVVGLARCDRLGFEHVLKGNDWAKLQSFFLAVPTEHESALQETANKLTDSKTGKARIYARLSQANLADKSLPGRQQALIYLKQKAGEVVVELSGNGKQD